MKIYSKSYFILLFLIFSQVNISALTLDEAVKNALNYNYLIISKKYELQSANYKLKAAKSLQMPSFFFKSTYTNLDNDKSISFSTPLGEQEIKISENDYVEVTTGIKLPLYTGGLISGNIDAAVNSIRIKKEQLKETKLDIIFNTKISYINILELKALEKIAEKHLKSLKKHKKDAEDFYHQGLVPYIDVLQTDVKVKEAVQKLTSIRNSIKVAKTNLSLIMGKSADNSYEVEKLNIKIKEKIKLSELYNLAKKNRPVLKEFQNRINQMDSFIKAKSSELKPKLAVIGGYNYSNAEKDLNDKDNFLLQTVLSFNLNWTNAIDEINSLKQTKFAIKNRKKNILSQILLGVKKAHEDYITAVSNLEVSKSAVKSANEYFRIINLKYREGLSDNTDVLDAEALKTDALMKEKTNYFNVLKKYFLLERVTGREGKNYE
jgi:outer membrane protein TolC